MPSEMSVIDDVCILQAAEVALQLHCIHRWCVTGTPIQKGLEGDTFMLQ